MPARRELQEGQGEEGREADPSEAEEDPPEEHRLSVRGLGERHLRHHLGEDFFGRAGPHSPNSGSPRTNNALHHHAWSLPGEEFPDGVVGVRVERRKTSDGWYWVVGLRGKGALAARSWLWQESASKGLPPFCGNPPCCVKAVTFYNDLLREAAELDVAACELPWRALKATMLSHPDYA